MYNGSMRLAVLLVACLTVSLALNSAARADETDTSDDLPLVQAETDSGAQILELNGKWIDLNEHAIQVQGVSGSAASEGASVGPDLPETPEGSTFTKPSEAVP